MKSKTSVLLILIVAMFFCGAFATRIVAFAATDGETAQPETVETGEALDEESEDEEIDKIIELLASDEGFKEKFKTLAITVLSNYMDPVIAAQIVTWAVAVLGAVAMVVVNLKYWRYRKTTTEDVKAVIKNSTNEIVSASLTLYQNATVESINRIEAEVEECMDRTEALIRAFIFAQDKTPESKLALLELLRRKLPENEDIQKEVEKVKEEISAEESVKAEVTDKVAGEYKEIF